MNKPQQPELRRSGFVAALDPDATESDLQAHDRPTKRGRGGPIPEDQRPGHHPDEEQDKPDLDAFAERLGIVPEGEEPADAPRVGDDAGEPAGAASTVTPIEEAPSRQATSKAPEAPRAAPDASDAAPTAAKARSWSPIGLVLVGPVTGVLVAKGVLRALSRARKR